MEGNNLTVLPNEFTRLCELRRFHIKGNNLSEPLQEMAESEEIDKTRWEGKWEKSDMELSLPRGLRLIFTYLRSKGVKRCNSLKVVLVGNEQVRIMRRETTERQSEREREKEGKREGGIVYVCMYVYVYVCVCECVCE